MSERVVWTWRPYDSNGYAHDVAAVTLLRTAKRVRIRILLSTGELVQRDVHPENVRAADAEYQQRHGAIYDALEQDQVEARP
jgi:hypothetical protein